MKAFFIVLLLFVSMLIHGQEHVVFEQLSTKDGLSDGTINAIFRDSRGFMWFCTNDGLNRYDGYKFKVYKSELNDVLFEQSVEFLAITEDRYGHIWIGTTEGLYVYDNENDRIVLFASLNSFELNDTPITGIVHCLLFDAHDYLWIGSYNGISRIKVSNPDIQTISLGDISQIRSNTNESLHLSDNRVTSFYEDQQDQIWVATQSNLLDCYNYEKNQISHHLIKIPTQEESDNQAKIISYDKNDNFWIGIMGSGLILWDQEKDTFTQIKHLREGSNSVDISMVKSLLVDKNGRMWIGTDGNGLVVFDRQKNDITHYSTSVDDQSKLSSNAIYSIFEDKSGIIWVGTYMMGLNKFASDKVNFGAIYSSPYSQTGLSHNFVTGFCEDKNHQIWISTDGGGLNVFNPKTYQHKHYQYDPGNANSLSVNSTIALLCDEQNSIWIGTYNGGLNRFDQKTQKFFHYWNDPNDPSSISSNHTWGFALDSSNNLWIATVDAGINLMKAGSSSFIRYKNLDGNNTTPNQLCSNAITQLFVDSKNFLWVGTEYGLDRVDLNQMNFNSSVPELVLKHYIMSNDENSLSYYRISCINEDETGNIWIGTKGGGLNILDVATQKIRHYSTQDGLPHNVIDGILFDADNNPWVSTNNGLSYFNTKTKKFKNYSSSDGLQSNVFVKTSCLKTNDGMFFFGGINGYNAFLPQKIVTKTVKLNALITDFKLFNQSVSVGSIIKDRILLPREIDRMDSILLFHTENNIEFEFSALDYSNPDKIYYAYQMEGLDQDWQITDAKLRIARYTNLGPGNYIFRVKASINEDIWSEASRSLVIVIQPPWWKTIWFKIMALIVVITIWIVGFSLRVYGLEKQKSILKLKIEEKTKQLKGAIEELSESNKMKDKFLSIMAHDLINPFNSILGYSDLLLSNYSQWDERTRLEMIKTINDSSTELYELLGNLLQWTRTERGLMEYSPEKIDLNTCITKIISLLSVSAKSKNISIDMMHLDENVWVNSDEQLLNAILRNLISNAIKFTPEGGEISVVTERKAKEMSISVMDNGVGISADRLNQLLRIDVHHSTLGTNNEKGTGLGLLLVKEFVVKQKGTMNIMSSEGKGSTFTFTVPLWNS